MKALKPQKMIKFKFAIPQTIQINWQAGDVAPIMEAYVGALVVEQHVATVLSVPHVDATLSQLKKS